jgi:hypothetical protein
VFQRHWRLIPFVSLRRIRFCLEKKFIGQLDETVPLELKRVACAVLAVCAPLAQKVLGFAKTGGVHPELPGGRDSPHSVE